MFWKMSSKNGKRPRSLSSSKETDSFFWILAKSLLILFGVVFFLAFFAFSVENHTDHNNNVRKGSYAVFATAFVLILYRKTQGINGPFIKPHPTFWGVVLCLGVLYELGLVFLLFQSVSYARELLTYLDPNLNQPIDYKSYGGFCTLWDSGHPDGPMHNIMDKMDSFVFSHFIGWLVKALILRDYWSTNLLSFGFELAEYTFEHQLPNFFECWWDHWVMDFLLCNGLGIFIGMKLIDYFSMKRYHWFRSRKEDLYPRKIKGVVEQTGAASWIQLRWRNFNDFARWVFVSFVMLFFTLADLNVFYLKFLLWLPPTHFINLSHLILIAILGLPAITEGYNYVTGQTEQPGQFCFLINLIFATEFLVVIKYGSDLLLQPMPIYMQWFWSAFLGVYVFITIFKIQITIPSWFKKLQIFKSKIVASDSENEFSEDEATLSDIELRSRNILRKRVIFAQSKTFFN